MLKKQIFLFWSLCLIFIANAAEIGSFPIKRELTSSKLVFPDKVVLERFDDPKIKGVSCYVSSVSKGGVTGAVGVATDPSDVAISCVRSGIIAVGDIDKGQKGEVVFSEKQSLFFKTLRVRRFFDAGAKTAAYVAYTDKAIMDGSYKTAVSAVFLGE